MTPIIALDNVSKAFGNTLVIEQVSLSLYAGEVHALMGENGAGKSTMVKMLSGVHKPDSGQLLLNGKPVAFNNTADAKAAGIAVIYQEPTLFPELSIAENIFMGRQPLNRYGMIDDVAMNHEVTKVLQELGIPLAPTLKVLGLSIAEQQIIEIAKALTVGAKVLIMDEPTAALSSKEVERLFRITNQLRETGVAILFISHRLEEVFTISQRVTIMRDGLVVDSGELSLFSTDDIIKKMVGRSLEALYPKIDVTPGEVVLKINQLQSEGVFSGIDFEIKAGEIVALAGLVGAGRSEVARAIFGIDPFDHGSIEIDNQIYMQMSPIQAMASGIGLVPEDRRAQGLVMPLSVMRNTTLTVMHKLQRNGRIRQHDEYEIAEKWTTKMQLRGHLEEPVSILSGGNQQKVVLAKWLATHPKCLIVDEPTRGVDVGAKAEVHRTLSELAAQGMAILMISSELPEVLGMADRILVMHEGRIEAEFSREQATEEKIMYAATGQKQRMSA